MRSGRVSRQWTRDKSSHIVKEFVSVVVELGGKKRYLTEPAVAVILDLVRKVHLSKHTLILLYHMICFYYSVMHRLRKLIQTAAVLLVCSNLTFNIKSVHFLLAVAVY